MDSLARTYSSSVDLPEEITRNCHKMCCRPLHDNLTMMGTSLMPLMLLLSFLVPLLLSFLLMLFLSFLLPFLFFSVSIISIFPQVYTSLTDTSTVVRKIIQTAITVGKTFCPTKTLETKTHVKPKLYNC